VEQSRAAGIPCPATGREAEATRGHPPGRQRPPDLPAIGARIAS
jgi:hypothetical protein